MNRERVSSHKRGHGQDLSTLHGLLEPQHTPNSSTVPGKGSVIRGRKPRKEKQEKQAAPLQPGLELELRTS